MNHRDWITARLGVHLLELRDNPSRAFAACGAAAGGLPLVEVQRPDGVAVARFAAYDTAFGGGVRAAVGELDGNPNTVEVVTGAGPGGGPHVKVFQIDLTNNNAVTQVASFYAFDPAFTGGVNVAVGNVAGPDLRQEIIVGADAGGGPHVRTFELNGGDAVQVGGPLGSFFAFEPQFAGGVRVAAGELDGNPADGDELVTAAGSGGGPRVKVYRQDGTVIADYYAFRQDYAGGVNVQVDSSAGAVGRLVVDGETTGASQRLASLNSLANVNGTSNGGNGSNNGGTTTSGVTTGTGTTSNGVGNTFNGGTLTSGNFSGVNGTNGQIGTSGLNGTGTASNNIGLVSAGNTAAILPAGTIGVGLNSGSTFGQQFGTFTTPSFGSFGSPGAVTAFPINGFSGFTGTTASGISQGTTSGATTGTTVGPFVGGLGNGTVIF